MTDRPLRYGILALVALAVGAYDSWQARAANGPFEWRRDLGGYYDLLARGFLSGHLYLPVQPSAKLLSLPNPYDPSLDDSVRLQDTVLYGSRYYLYFGAAPAVVLFAPWRLVAGHDLPENFALWLLCFGGFLFGCGALLEVIEIAEARPGPVLLAFLFLALGVCQSAPFLLNRAAVYEVAIASGYCFALGGVCFLARSIARRPMVNLAASGAMFGLAAGSRPHLALAGMAALALVAVFHLRRQSRAFAAFATAWAIVGLAIAVYNYERFGNPLEFGFRYQLAGPGQNRVELAAHNALPGVYYMLLSRPELSGVFPWMRMVFRFPFDSAVRYPLPPDYFVEPTVGALWLAPFLLAAWPLRPRFAKRPEEARLIVGAAALAGVAVLLFLISTHLATHRYEVDFAGLLVFAAVANLALMRRRVLRVAACVAIAYSVAANLAIAFAGPYDDFLREHPARYVRLARRFSPARQFRPALSPAIAVRVNARFLPAPAGYHEPLVTIGHSHYCYFLYAERGGRTLRLISKTNDSEMAFELPEPGDLPVGIALDYTPGSGEMAVRVNGAEALRHAVGPLVTAPAEVAIGENLADMGLTARRFTGRIEVLDKTVVEGPR